MHLALLIPFLCFLLPKFLHKSLFHFHGSALLTLVHMLLLLVTTHCAFNVKSLTTFCHNDARRGHQVLNMSLRLLWLLKCHNGQALARSNFFWILVFGFPPPSKGALLEGACNGCGAPAHAACVHCFFHSVGHSPPHPCSLWRTVLLCRNGAWSYCCDYSPAMLHAHAAPCRPGAGAGRGQLDQRQR